MVEPGAYINRNAWIDAIHSFGTQEFNPSIKIGKNFSAADRLHISAINSISIGNDCLFGSGVYISDHNHGSYKGDIQSDVSEAPIERHLTSFGKVDIGSNVWLGDNVIVVGSVTIGSGSVIGANSVITKNVPPNIMVAGSPYRILKVFNEKSKRWE
jgi:lipopolysaccharide O-acetyltransferase